MHGKKPLKKRDRKYTESACCPVCFSKMNRIVGITEFKCKACAKAKRKANGQ